MEIKASGTLNYDGVKYLFYTSLFNKLNPKTGMALSITVFTLMFALYLAISLLVNIMYLPIAFLWALLILVFCLLIFFMPKRQYKALSKMQNLQNEYVFCDDKIYISAENAVYKEKTEIKYELIEKTVETKKYIFIYQNMLQALIVNKETITNGTVDDLRRKLVPILGKKYIICNY